jgi:hypothetical protein
MPYAKADVERAIELWKLAIKSPHGLAIATNRDRRWFKGILDEARRVYLSTEEAYELTPIIPAEPEDEVWLVRRYENEQSNLRRPEREEQN